MANNNDKKKENNENKEEVVFSVMPQTEDTVLSDGSRIQNNPTSEAVALPEEKHTIWHNKVTYIVVGVLLLLVLAGLAYFLLGSGNPKSANQVSDTKLPTVFLKRYFFVDVCTEPGKCSDAADPDNDGLNNYDEFKEQTDPTQNDSDNDGLADGDEINIYATDPRSKYTDSRPISEQNDYNDGSQIKNEYDPLTPGLKMTEVRKQQIKTNIEKFQLHSPTKETLSANIPAPKTVNITIANNKIVENPITVNVNDTIIWTNKDLMPHQIASDPHPTHTDVNDLESGSLATNQTYSYKFTKAGTYSYHDHLNPSIKGTVIVQ
ncbi:MAG TPA: cupredoxin domain-containing protein [Candidatus Binatia bacterium]|nr:cupredoxin domain-containing protein [Candidatus Binatia bacterium]